MISIVEKDNSFILVLEQPTYEERMLLDQAKLLMDKENNQQPQQILPQSQPKDIPDNDVYNSIDWSRFGNANVLSQPKYVRVTAKSKRGDIIFDEESLDKNDMYHAADFYRREGYIVTTNESETPTKMIKAAPIPNVNTVPEKEEQIIGIGDLSDFEEIINDGGVPF